MRGVRFTLHLQQFIVQTESDSSTAPSPCCRLLLLRPVWDQLPRTPRFLPRVLTLTALRNIGQVFSRPSLNLVGLLGCCSQVSGILGLGITGQNSAPSRRDTSGCVLLTWLTAAGLDLWAKVSARLLPSQPTLGKGLWAATPGPSGACPIPSCWMSRGAGWLAHVTAAMRTGLSTPGEGTGSG